MRPLSKASGHRSNTHSAFLPGWPARPVSGQTGLSGRAATRSTLITSINSTPTTSLNHAPRIFHHSQKNYYTIEPPARRGPAALCRPVPSDALRPRPAFQDCTSCTLYFPPPSSLCLCVRQFFAQATRHHASPVDPGTHFPPTCTTVLFRTPQSRHARITVLTYSPLTSRQDL